MSRRRSRGGDARRSGTRSATARRRRGVPEHTAALVFEKILAFSAFGFPKAHAAAFALLAYQSAWLRRYHPAAFLCSLLNAQPMGFYPPASLIRDGQRRGVEVLPPDVNALARRSAGSSDGAVRVGLGYVTRPRRGAAPRRGGGARAATARSPTGATSRRRARAEGRRAASGWSPSGACDALGPRRRAAVGARPRRPRRCRCAAAPPAGARPRPRRLARAARAGRLGPARRRLRPHRPVAARASDRATSGVTLDGVVSSADLADAAQRHADRASPGLAIARQRPGQRERRRLPAARGRARARQPDPDAATSTSGSGCSPAPSRCCSRPARWSAASATSTCSRAARAAETPGRRTIGAHHRDRNRRQPAAAAVQDLRAVAPPAMHFAQGRRRA